MTTATSSSPYPIDFRKIAPLSPEPIKSIPTYVFGNCNQVTTNNYPDAYLTALRGRVRVVTAKEVRAKAQSEEAFVKKAEELDWIYGLDTLEGELLKKVEKPGDVERSLSSKSLIRYNGLFSRMINSTAGEYRTHSIKWTLGDRTDLEHLLVALFEKQVVIGKGPDFLSIGQTMTDSEKPTYLLSQENVKILLKFVADHPEMLTPDSTCTDEIVKNTLRELREANLDELIKSWVDEQGRDDGLIDLCAWLYKRNHYFPLAKDIEKNIEEALDAVKSETMHPIEKAALVWFKLVEQHVSHEANKRTGKGLASAILLSHGYLPPEIRAEDTKEYTKTLNVGFGKENGHLPFVHFVARKIVEAQAKYGNFF